MGPVEKTLEMMKNYKPNVLKPYFYVTKQNPHCDLEKCSPTSNQFLTHKFRTQK